MSREFSLTLDGTTYRIVVDGNSILVNGQPFVVGLEEERVLVDGTPYDVTLEENQVVVGGIAYGLSVKGLEEEKAGPRAAARAVICWRPGAVLTTVCRARPCWVLATNPSD